MNVTVEDLAPCRKLVRVEVETESVNAAFDEVTRKVRRQARVPGFRPGKAPVDRVEKAYAKEIEDEVKRKLIGDTYAKAVKEQSLTPIDYPDIEEIQFGRGQPLQFAATIETAPQFDLPDYKGLPVRMEVSFVTDEDVERAITVLREQQAKYEDVSRPAQPGDFVVLNYSGTSEGKPLTEFSPASRGITRKENFWMQIEPGHFVPGFTEQLVGMQAGDKKSIEVEFPQDFVAKDLVGRKAVYEVEAVQIKEKKLPELTEEFAKSFGADDLEKLKEGIRRDLQNELEFKQRRSIRNQLVGRLLERVNFDLPESVVQEATRNVVYDIVRENTARGVSTEAIESQRDEIYSAAAHSAKDRVKMSFLFKRIAEKENIKVTDDEFNQRIHVMAQQNQIPPAKFVKQLKEQNGLVEIHDQIRSSKVLDFLERQARIEQVPAGSLGQ